MSIVTLTLNPAFDLTMRVPDLRLNQVNRATHAQLLPAGKGLNVACVLKGLKQDVKTVGFIGAGEYARFQDFCQEQGLACHWIKVDGTTRINIKVADSASQMTEINMPSFQVNMQHLGELEHALDGVHVHAVVLSGRLPQGLPDETYANIIYRLRKRQIPVFFDASGCAFKMGVEAQPFLIKPNHAELEELINKKITDPEELLTAGRTLMAQGIKHVVISQGAAGVYWITESACYRAIPPKMPVQSTVGAGDSLVAGLVYGMTQNWPQTDILRLATALSALAVTRVQLGVHTQADCARIQQQVRIELLQ